jgi:hypothetical protein
MSGAMATQQHSFRQVVVVTDYLQRRKLAIPGNSRKTPDLADDNLVHFESDSLLRPSRPDDLSSLFWFKHGNPV